MSAIDPAHVMSQDARVHYQIGDGDDTATLPDSYNGLGFKNLIYMVVEILDAQARWTTMDNRPPLHLIFVESRRPTYTPNSNRSSSVMSLNS